MTTIIYMVICADKKHPQIDSINVCELHEPFKGVIFTHGTIKLPKLPPGWCVKTIDSTAMLKNNKHDRECSARKISRYVKINSHIALADFSYEFSIYMDSNMTPGNFLKQLIRVLFDTKIDIVTARHKARSCIYDEIAVCCKKKLDPDIEQFMSLRKFLQSERYPKKEGLACCSVLLRKNSTEIIKFNELWWLLVDMYVIRDQCSFNYVLWKTKIGYIDVNFEQLQNKLRLRGHSVKK